MSTTNFDRYNLKNAGGDAMLDREGDNVREDFFRAIQNISPTRTPFMTGIGTETCSDIFTSWLQDDLAAVNPANKLIDGQDMPSDSSAKARRVGNICQISGKGIAVSGRADTVGKIGRSNELNYQLAKASAALKRDMEAILTGNQAAAIGASDTASTLGGLRACFRDATGAESEVALVNTASTGANGGAVATGGVTAATDAAALRQMTETLLRDCIRGIYDNGGEADTIMVTPLMKQRFSEYLYTSSARVAALYSDIGKQSASSGGAAAQASVDLYISDFGTMKIVPNRFMGHTGSAPRNRDVFVLDMALWAVGYLRRYQTKQIAETGDAKKRMLLVDYTLVYRQEMGSGGVFDVDSSLAIAP